MRIKISSQKDLNAINWELERRDIIIISDYEKDKIVIDDSNIKSRIEISGLTRAHIYGSCIVYATACANITLHDSALAIISDQTYCVALDSSCAISYDHARVRAKNKALVIARSGIIADCTDQVVALSFGWSKIKASGNAKVFAYGHSKVNLKENASIVSHGANVVIKRSALAI